MDAWYDYYLFEILGNPIPKRMCPIVVITKIRYIPGQHRMFAEGMKGFSFSHFELSPNSR